MFGCLTGIINLSVYLTSTIVFGILAIAPLAGVCAVYTGKWATITIHDLLMLNDSAFASALGGVLSDNPLWQLIYGILGGIAEQLHTDINMQLFFADAAYLNLNLYTVLELIGSAVFMMLWFRVQMDVLSCIFRLKPMSTFSIDKGTIGCILEPMLNSIYFSISLLGAFFNTVLFNAMRDSRIPGVYMMIVLAAEVVLFFGCRALSGRGSIFGESLLGEIAGSLIKTGTLLISMYISFFYFGGGVPKGDWRILLIILSWIAATNGVAGDTIGLKVGGFAVTAVCACLLGV